MSVSERTDLTAVHFMRGDVHGVVVVHDTEAMMVAGMAGANGFRTELREPTADELEEYMERREP